jgi:hypothetical protein
MKTNYLTVLAMLFISLTTLAQESAPRLALTVGIGNSYNLTSKNSALKDYYGLEGKASLLINDKWFVGYTQSQSSTPGNLLKDESRVSGFKKSGINNYFLSAGRKWNAGEKLYFTGGVNFGVSEFKTRAANESGSPAKSNSNMSFLAGTETGMGFNLNKYLALEAGVNYRRYFKNEALAINVKDLNSLGFSVSLIGKLNLKK